MFTPIKNLITYIQKNASGNSIFGGNNAAEETAKIETENMRTETESATAASTATETMQAESEIIKEKDEKDTMKAYIEDKNEKLGKDKDKEEGKGKGKGKEKQNEESRLEPIEPETKTSGSCTTTKVETASTVSTENSREFDEYDIEAQIERSIMLKKPVKVAISSGSEIFEVKKLSNANCSIVITHDYNRNQALTPIDDELEDFHHDPTELLASTSSPCSNQQVDEFSSVGSEDEVLERDVATADEFVTEDEVEMEEDNDETEEERRAMDEETDLEEDDKDNEIVNEQKDIIEVHDDEDEEELFLDLDTFNHTNVIVLDEVDLNASSASIDTNNTADDPLAIACEEQEAFAADKAAALEQLNLLNTSQTSQDDDTRTTADDDLQWLKTELEDNQPSCSNKQLLKENVSEATPEKEERNGEGSDSGLGSETSALHTTTTSITDTSQLNMTTVTPNQTPTQMKTKDSEKLLVSNSLQITKTPPKDPRKPYRSNLKRRLEVDDDDVAGLGSLTSTTSALNDHSSINGSIQKKPKRSINFDNVQVYYFPRQQGFSCVPSAGGCTLGMGAMHVAFKTLTLAEHAAELRRAHRMQLQEINPRGSSSDDSEESEEDYLSEGSGSDLDGESNGFLQPVSPKQRRALLKAAGIRKIDPSEKADCRNIRNSREVCGCTCRDFCDPETCACSQSGIKCQVDRDMFPCGCSRDACGNTIGRVEFNPTRVRTHYIHTLMRLEMENRQQQNPYSSAVASPMQPTPSSYYQNHLQPQSNYSSGYASPAYNTASELHQQTAANSYYHTQNHPTSTSNGGLYGQQTSLEMSHNGSAANGTTTASQYSMDSLDSSLFGGTSTATPSYGELMPVSSYHYGNMQTQASPYNSYHNSPSIYANNTTTSPVNTPNTYSSCAVPSIPPYGTATTTEATGVYHTVSSLTGLETTTAPSCSVSASLENDASASFISLSTPLASSSRLSQINDLLQHNRNATTALVAVSQNIAATESNSPESAVQVNGSNLQSSTSSSSSSSINTPPMEDGHKSCMDYEELTPPLKPAPIVAVIENDNNSGPLNKPTTLKLPPPETPIVAAGDETLKLEEPTTTAESAVLNTALLPETHSLAKGDQDNTSSTVVTVSATIETATIEVAAGN